jgi:predicted phosphoribosyltransferase/dienelactone hydrolase
MYEVDINIPSVNLVGSLTIPPSSKVLIIFIHGSGSNRFSTRNTYISRFFNKEGYSTLLIDLLSEHEKQEDRESKHIRFDIDLLSKRIVSIVEWVSINPLTRDLAIGFFSASTATAAALNSLVHLTNIKAIVSRGGRIDLCHSNALRELHVPLLLIVGSRDDVVASITKRTIKGFSDSVNVKLCLVPGTSHFFEEPGKMDIVAKLSLLWFDIYLKHSKSNFVNEYKGNWLQSLSENRPHFRIKFQNRVAAGHLLANMLTEYKKTENLLIIGIPRGGIIIADILAEKLSNAEFGLIMIKRLRNPNNSESTIGTILSDGSAYFNAEASNISDGYIKMEISAQKRELSNQIALYNLGEYKINFQGKRIILVDDGANTGSTLIAVSRLVKLQNPLEITAALPVIPNNLVPILKREGIEVKYIQSPRNFKSVDAYYKDFSQVDDSQVVSIVNHRLRFHTRGSFNSQ